MLCTTYCNLLYLCCPRLFFHFFHGAFSAKRRSHSLSLKHKWKDEQCHSFSMTYTHRHTFTFTAIYCYALQNWALTSCVCVCVYDFTSWIEVILTQAEMHKAHMWTTFPDKRIGWRWASTSVWRIARYHKSANLIHGEAVMMGKEESVSQCPRPIKFAVARMDFFPSQCLFLARTCTNTVRISAFSFLTMRSKILCSVSSHLLRVRWAARKSCSLNLTLVQSSSPQAAATIILLLQ